MTEKRCKLCNHLEKYHNSSGKCTWKYALSHKTCPCLNVSYSTMHNTLENVNVMNASDKKIRKEVKP